MEFCSFVFINECLTVPQRLKLSAFESDESKSMLGSSKTSFTCFAIARCMAKFDSI